MTSKTKPRPLPKVESWSMTDLAREAMERERAKARAKYEANREEILAKARAKTAANPTTKVDRRTLDEVEQGRIRYKELQASKAKLRAELRQAMIATGLDTNSMNQFPRFPIWGTSESIPWAVIEPHRAQAFKNHAMSLTMLAQRGGLDWPELLAVLNDRPFRRVPEVDARRQVEEIIASRFQSQPPVAL